MAVASAGRDESSIVASESENQTRLWKQRRLPEFRKQRVLGVEDRGLSVSTQTVNSAEWGFNQDSRRPAEEIPSVCRRRGKPTVLDPGSRHRRGRSRVCAFFGSVFSYFRPFNPVRALTRGYTPSPLPAYPSSCLTFVCITLWSSTPNAGRFPTTCGSLTLRVGVFRPVILSTASLKLH